MFWYYSAFAAVPLQIDRVEMVLAESSFTDIVARKAYLYFSPLNQASNFSTKYFGKTPLEVAVISGRLSPIKKMCIRTDNVLCADTTHSVAISTQTTDSHDSTDNVLIKLMRYLQRELNHVISEFRLVFGTSSAVTRCVSLSASKTLEQHLTRCMEKVLWLFICHKLWRFLSS